MKIVEIIDQFIESLLNCFSPLDEIRLFGSSRDYKYLSDILKTKAIPFQTIDSIHVITVLDYNEEVILNIQNSLVCGEYDEDLFTDKQISFNGDHVHFLIGSLHYSSTYYLYAVLYPYEFSHDPVLLWLHEMKTTNADYLKKISRFEILNKDR